MEQNKPIILYSRTKNPLNNPEYFKPYQSSIERVGGIFKIIPEQLDKSKVDELFASANGFLIPGGADINPARYHQEKKDYTFESDNPRDQLESDIVSFALAYGVPVLGICRGLQVMNVALGGNLFQDVQKERLEGVKHDFHLDGPRSALTHFVDVKKNSLLGRILDTEQVEVNSLHHQGINQLGKGLVPVAIARDGLIEAVEISNHPFFIGVQWHPEELIEKNPVWDKLFRVFVAAARDASFMLRFE